MKHVTEARLTEGDELHCGICGDQFTLAFHPDVEPPLWVQLALKDAFASLHRDCAGVPQQVPTVETLRYERAD